MSRKTTAEIIDRISHQKSERSNHENAWRDIMDLMYQYRGDITTKTEGNTRIKGVIDSTPASAAQDLVSWIKGQVAPTQIPWIRFQVEESLKDEVEIVRLFDSAANKVLQRLSESNFYVQLESFLRDLILPGNGIFHVEEGKKKVNQRTGSTFGGLIFKAVPFFDMWWTYGKDIQPMWTTREWWLPAMSAYKFFNGKPGITAMQALSESPGSNPFTPHRYFNAVFENEEGIPGGITLPEDKPWHSVWVSDSDNEMVGDLQGFDFNPYTVARLKIVQDHTYGYGQGHAARPDAKASNAIKSKELVALAKALDPKLMYEAGSLEKLSGGAGGAIVVKAPTHSRPQYLETRTDFAAAAAIQNQEREEIKKMFLADVISNPDTQPRSAQESQLREIRSMRRMGGDADAVFMALSPVIENVASLMHDAGDLPEFDIIFDNVPGASFDIRFVSPFFTAQNQGSLQQVDAYLERMQVLAQGSGDQSYLDQVDPDEVSRYYARNGNVPFEILRTDEEIAEIREARAQQAAQQQQLEQMQQAASAAKDVAQVEGAQPAG